MVARVAGLRLKQSCLARGDAWRQLCALRACKHSLRGHLGTVRGIAISQKGDFLVTSSADKTVKVWDLTLTHLDGK